MSFNPSASMASLLKWIKIDELKATLSERRRSLEVISIFYLLAPYVIFCITWLKPWVACLVLLITAWAVRGFLLTRSPIPPLRLPKKNRIPILASIIAIILFWAFFSGVGGFTAQAGDYLKHNAIFHDLMSYKWPIVYSNGYGLSYYIGYYLPSAAFGKLTSPALADYFQLFWMILGLFLVFYWICRLTKRVNIWLALLFVGFSGMDIIGFIIGHHTLPTLGFLALEWSTSPDVGFWQYSANATLLDWTPQHAIAGWLVTGMIVAEYVEKKAKKNTIFIYSLIWLTSPIIATWLAVIIFGILASSYKNLRSFINFQNIAFPLVMLIVVGSFFMTNMYSQPIGFIWDFLDFRANLKNLFFFHLLEYGIYAALILPFVLKKESKEWKVLFITTLLLLAVMPFFMYGLYNDQLMRGSIPTLFILMVMIARMYKSKGYQLNKIALTLCLIIGVAVPVFEIWNHLEIGKPKYNDWISIENNNLDPGTRNLANQYYGDRNSFFYKVLAQ